MDSLALVILLAFKGTSMPPQTINDGALFFDPKSGSLSQGAYTSVGQGTQAIAPSIYDQNGSVNGVATSPANGTATPASAAGAQSASSKAYYQQLNDQLNFQKGLIPGQAATGHANVLAEYNRAYQGLVNDQGTADQQAGIQRAQSVTDNSLARDQVGRNVYDQTSALQRLLGAHGAGDSSAANIEVPYEAALQGNQQLTGIQRDYGRNLSALDLADSHRKQQFGNAFGQLMTDKQNNDSNIESGLATTQQGLDQSIARYKAYAGQTIDPNATNEVNALSQKVADLGRKATFTPQAIDSSVPNLAAYTADRYAAPGATPTIDPALQGPTGAYAGLIGMDKNKNKIGA